ncbi:MAG: hypothetical protein ACLUN6_04105, partial [Holdemanella sp.]|uniref:hypothetical protein n=1 Tax=Holdemanella sp. TaxID=1971762 RepID=UPI0039945D97
KLGIDVFRGRAACSACPDGICWMDGLADIMHGEPVEFVNGERGMVMDIRADRVGCIIFGRYDHVDSYSRVRRLEQDGKRARRRGDARPRCGRARQAHRRPGPHLEHRDPPHRIPVRPPFPTGSRSPCRCTPASRRSTHSCPLAVASVSSSSATVDRQNRHCH